MGGCCIFKWKMMFEQGLEGSGEVIYVTPWGKSVSDGGYSQCKGAETEVDFACDIQSGGCNWAE